MLEALFVYAGVGALVLLWVSQGQWADEEHTNALEAVATVLFFLVLWPVWPICLPVVTPRNGEF